MEEAAEAEQLFSDLNTLTNIKINPLTLESCIADEVLIQRTFDIYKVASKIKLKNVFCLKKPNKTT